ERAGRNDAAARGLVALERELRELAGEAFPAQLGRRLRVQVLDRAAVHPICEESNRAVNGDLEAARGGVVDDLRHSGHGLLLNKKMERRLLIACTAPT